jgi:outer membrane lipoprotein-sorting protein
MRRQFFYLGTLSMALTFGTAVASAETVEEVGKKIAAANDKLTSFSAKTKMVMEMKQEGFSMTGTTEGTTEMLRKGSDLLMRVENKSVSETNVGGNVTKQDGYSLAINDGAFMYTLSEMAGVKSAQKNTPVKPDTDPLKMWKAMGELKLLPDATVEGRAAWVIEATPKAETGQGKTVMSFDKESGQMIKMINHSPDGKPMNTLTVTDIKVNDKLSPDRFVFKAPPGVEVQDMTK